MWRAACFGTDVFVSEAGDLHFCGQKCDQPSVRVHGVDVCPLSWMSQGAGAAQEDEEETAVDEGETATQARSTRYDDPLNVDGSLAVGNIAQSLFLRLFAKKICKSDAVIRRSLLARMPGRDIEPVMQQIKASMLNAAELEEIANLAAAFHLVISDEERPHKVPYETVLCAVLHHSATPHGLRLDGRVVIAPNARVRALMPIERAFDTQAGVPVSSVKIGIGLISRHIEKLAGLTPRPTLMNTGAALSSRSRRAPYLTRPAG